MAQHLIIHQVLWFGTPSGLHQMRLIDDVISHSGLLENPGTDEISTKDINNIGQFILSEQIILGSNAGTWVVSGDYSNVSEIDQQEIIPGFISEIITIGDSDNMTILGAAEPEKYDKLMNPKSNDSIVMEYRMVETAMV